MKAKVLIVDDDEAIRWIVERKIKKHRYDAMTCASSSEAFCAIERRVPDLVLSDCNLSESDNGVQLARAIRKRTGLAIPVIIMSGSADCQQQAFAHGFEYISKPFDLSYLMGIIGKALDNQSSVGGTRKPELTGVPCTAGRHLNL